MNITEIKSIASMEYLYQRLAEKKAWSFDTETTVKHELAKRGQVLDPYIEELRTKRKYKEAPDKEVREAAWKLRRKDLLKSDLRLHPKKVKLFCIAFYVPDEVFYLEIDNICEESQGLLKNKLSKIFSLSNIKIAHWATFDINVMENFGVHVVVPIWCTKTMACVHDENDVEIHVSKDGTETISNRYGLKWLAKKYFDADDPDVDMKKVDISEVPLENRLKYCGNDAIWCYKLAKIFLRGIKEEKTQKAWKIENRVTSIFAEIERTGVRLDTKYIKKALGILEDKQKELEEKIYEMLGAEINLNSNQQLAKVLFEDLGLPTDRKNKTGYSVDKSVLSKLKNKHPAISLLLKRKSVEKTKNTYLTPYIKKEYKDRLYFNLNAWGTRTGRTSSSGPNFGQLPRTTGNSWERIPKKAILPDKGHLFISADRNQAEYRFLAGLSKDPKILRAYKKDPLTDFHMMVAKDLYENKWDQMTEEQKKKLRADRGKKVNFATVYGQSDKALAELLGITEDKAERFHNKYFIKYPGIKSFQNDTFRFLEKHGYIRTYFGRKRRLPKIHSRKWGEKDHAKRQAFNTRIQSPASGDLIKIDLYNVDNYIKKNYPGKARIVLTVYDELLISAHRSIVKRLAGEVKEIMEKAIDFPVPLLVDKKIKQRWGGKEVGRS